MNPRPLDAARAAAVYRVLLVIGLIALGLAVLMAATADPSGACSSDSKDQSNPLDHETKELHHARSC